MWWSESEGPQQVVVSGSLIILLVFFLHRQGSKSFVDGNSASRLTAAPLGHQETSAGSGYSYWSRQSWSLCWTSSACRRTGAFVMVSVRWVQDDVMFRPRTLVCLGTGAMMDILKHVKTTSRSCLDTSTVHKDDLFRYFDARSNYDLIIMRKQSFLQKTVHCFQVLEISMATSAG